MVAEADEYDRAFLALHPVSAIVTNIDADHLEIYGTLSAVEDAFVQFLNGLPSQGVAIVNGEDAGVRRILNRVVGRVCTYGLSSGDYRALNVEANAEGMHFTLWRSGEELGRIRLKVPGRHNVSNALAAAALALEEGIPFTAVADGLGTFPGMQRRLEQIVGSRSWMIMPTILLKSRRRWMRFGPWSSGVCPCCFNRIFIRGRNS